MKPREPFVLYLLMVITYSQAVKPILDTRCVECHSKGSGLDLSNFPFSSEMLGSQKAIADEILSRIETKPPEMPPGNRPKLNAKQVSTIRQWRDEGLLP